MKGKLILEDGSSFKGELLNNIKATGEVVFHTGVTGYQEILTDPSYCRQIVTMTYPLIGNVGVAELYMQSRKSFVNGFIIGELCDTPSNWHTEGTLESFLTKQGIPCLYNVDTRAITRKIRSVGSMRGVIVADDATKAEIDELFAMPSKKDVVSEVTTSEIYTIDAEGPSVVAIDFGVKRSLLNALHSFGCKITVVPANTTAEEIVKMNPDGIFLSNGPGDPAELQTAIETVKKLIILKKPILGVCLGHQVLGTALGAKSYKLKFGHHGGNHPVKNLMTGEVQITTQSHSYTLDETSLINLPLKVTHTSLNDGTIEGICHMEYPIMSVQYHPEVSSSIRDSENIFKKFYALLVKGE